MTAPENSLSSPVIHVLIVEDGEEYSQAFRRFLPSGFLFERAGSGGQALELLPGPFDLVFLDMRFDRVPPESLLGDLGALLNRFNGESARATRFLEDNQGTYILAAMRSAGIRLPAVISHDFTDEPRRWANLQRLHGPLAWLPDNAGPEQVRQTLLLMGLPAMHQVPARAPAL